MNFTVEYPRKSVNLYVHKDNTVTVSQYGSWLPGYYESREAALASLKLHPVRLAELADAARKRRSPITLQELA